MHPARTGARGTHRHHGHRAGQHRRRRSEQAEVRARREREAAPRKESTLASLGMSSGHVGVLAAAVDAFRAEVREMRRSPGLWIFVPLIILQTVGPAIYSPGPFDTPTLTTPGNFAAQSYNTITLLSIFLMLYYFTESLARDERSRIASIVNASPSRTGALTLGRMAACTTVVAVALFGGLWAAMILAMVVQGVQCSFQVPARWSSPGAPCFCPRSLRGCAS